MATTTRWMILNLLLVSLVSGSGIAGCTHFSRDGGFDRVIDQAHEEIGKDVRWPRSAAERDKNAAAVAELLAHPLQVDDAVQIALLNNPGLQASFEELGISEADLVQSGRLANPRLTFRHASAAGLYDIEETVTFNVLSLLTMPAAHAAEQRRFGQIQDLTIMRVVELADSTRTAYFTALGARDSLHYAWQVKDAAQTAAELARRMLSAGNWNRLDQAREQAFYTAALQDLARAQLAEETASAALNALLGLAAARAVPLAAQLPDLPQNVVELPNLEQLAMQKRIDLHRMRAEIDELAHRLNLTRASRLVNVLDLGPTRVRNGTGEDPYEKGYEITLEVPIFDSGDARVRKAEALYARSVARLAQAALDARAAVRIGAARYRTAYEIAVRERDEALPDVKAITRQDLLRYNASQISVFELLADARAQIATVNDSIRSTRDFWIAQSHLDTVLIAEPR